MTTPLKAYRARFGKVEGFFTEEAQVAWDFLLGNQALMNVRGDVVEIGVWKGKSAGLAALHMRPDETLTLVDIQDLKEVEDRIRALGGPQVRSFTGKSSNFRASAAYRAIEPVRWFHIDGDHSGFSTTIDLNIAADLLGGHGIICVDDFFNPRYPQLAAAVFRFLFNRPEYRMLLCGANKVFICRSEDYALYESLIRKYLAAHMASCGISVTIAKTSYAHDFGCFAIEGRQGRHDVVGRDEDITDIVF
ncbi:MAG TPA: class I SAM-dependent methyltransferase [Crenalkalicoccus sp.]|jgi:hypothetical protein|nr:class I SAM-dependent methyltransferase [Crenalkalicoccus sp.]